MASPRFRAAALRDARQRAGLTQLELAARATEAEDRLRQVSSDESAVQARRIRTWESRIGAWEKGIDSPSASYIPTLSRLLEVEPLALFEVDSAAPPFTALRMAAGFTLQALAGATGVSYTSLYRMVRGVTRLPHDLADRLAERLGVTGDEVRASIARDR